MLFLRKKLNEAALILLSLSFFCLAQYEEEEEDEPFKDMDCTHCQMCKRRCEDLSDLSPEHALCVRMQSFCCGRRDKCSPFSARSVPPWGYGLLTLLTLSLLTATLFWLCSGRPNVFSRSPAAIFCCGNVNPEAGPRQHPTQSKEDDSNPPQEPEEDQTLEDSDEEDEDDDDEEDDESDSCITTITTVQ